MNGPWTNGYRHGMEHCLAILAPLLDGDNADIPAVREAVRMLHHQMPQPLEPTAAGQARTRTATPFWSPANATPD